MKEISFINLTPHKIVVSCGEKEITFPPSGEVVRLKTVECDRGFLNGIPTIAREFSVPEGLPEPKEGTIYIVSSIVLDSCNRGDLVAPDTGGTAIRDDNGRITAVTRFIRK